MTGGPRVVIVGGSLAGLTAALILRDAGCDVEVFERTPVTLEGRGAGIVLHPRTVQYLVDNAPGSLEGISVSARWFRYLGQDGGTLHEEPCRYRFTSYTSIYHPLRLLLGPERYHVGEEAVDFEQDADGVTVRFASGRVEKAEMLVCADGVNSAGRRWLEPAAQQQYAGYVAWRGTVGEQELSASSRAALVEAITYYVSATPGDGEHVLAYPIPGPQIAEGGAPLSNWLWYRNIAEADHDSFLIDRDGTRLVASVPPGAVQDRFLEEMRSDAAKRLPPPLSELMHRTAQPFVQVIFDIGVKRMAYGRVCIIGDGAFAVRPHVAAGAAKGADDAWALGEAVLMSPHDIPAALAAWEPGQLQLGNHVLQRSREVGNSMQFEGTWTAGEPLPFGLRERGDGSMSELVTTRG